MLELMMIPTAEHCLPRPRLDGLEVYSGLCDDRWIFLELDDALGGLATSTSEESVEISYECVWAWHVDLLIAWVTYMRSLPRLSSSTTYLGSETCLMCKRAYATDFLHNHLIFVAISSLHTYKSSLRSTYCAPDPTYTLKCNAQTCSS